MVPYYVTFATYYVTCKITDVTKSLPEPALRRHRDEMLGKAKAPYCAYLLHAMKPCMISGG